MCERDFAHIIYTRIRPVNELISILNYNLSRNFIFKLYSMAVDYIISKMREFKFEILINLTHLHIKINWYQKSSLLFRI